MREVKIHDGMISGFPRNKHIFRKVGNHVYPINIPNVAEYIYSVSDTYNPDGFGGTPVSFNMEDGTTYVSKGTWHSNIGNLPKDLQIEFKATYQTHCVISHTNIKTDNYGGTIIIEDEDDIIFMDDEWVLGEFDRGIKLAEEYAHKLSKDVYYKSTTSGGGSRYHTELYDMKR